MFCKTTVAGLVVLSSRLGLGAGLRNGLGPRSKVLQMFWFELVIGVGLGRG